MAFIISLSLFKTEMLQTINIHTLCTRGPRLMNLCCHGSNRTVYAQIKVKFHFLDKEFCFKCKISKTVHLRILLATDIIYFPRHHHSSLFAPNKRRIMPSRCLSNQLCFVPPFWTSYWSSRQPSQFGL